MTSNNFPVFFYSTQIHSYMYLTSGYMAVRYKPIWEVTKQIVQTPGPLVFPCYSLCVPQSFLLFKCIC